MKLKLPNFLKPNRDKRYKEIEPLIVRSLGIPVRNWRLYVTAMRHKSAARNIYNARELSNERLEFLGDAVLDSVIAEHLFVKYPEAEEGALTKMKSRIVSRTNLNNMAQKMGLSELIETDLQATHSRGSIGGNALEALFGAMYLDLGYVKSQRQMLDLFSKYSDLDAIEDSESDFKSRLFEEAHKLKGSLKFITSSVGEDKGAKKFLAKAILNHKMLGEGEGASKKKAEQLAAKRALKKLNTH